MALQPPPLTKAERIQQAEGRVATFEFLIRAYWNRLKHGDQTPSPADLRKWIRAAIEDLRKWREELEEAQAEPLPSIA